MEDSDERRRLSRLDMALLAHLMRGPLSGYDLAAAMRFPVALFWHARQSQIYSELRRMEQRGWIGVTEESSSKGPTRRVYSVKEQGLEALRAWLDAPFEPQPVRDEMTLRTYSMWVVDREIAIRYYREAAAFWASRLEFFESVITAWRAQAGERLKLANTPEFSNLLTMLRGRARAREQLAFAHEALDALASTVGSELDARWLQSQPARHTTTPSPIRPSELSEEGRRRDDKGGRRR